MQIFMDTANIDAIRRGAALGVVFAWWGSRLIVAQLSTTTNRVFLDVGLDWRLLAFTGVIAVGTSLLFGTLPAVRAARVAPIDAMKEQGRGTSSGRSVGLAGSLVGRGAIVASGGRRRGRHLLVAGDDVRIEIAE